MNVLRHKRNTLLNLFLYKLFATEIVSKLKRGVNVEKLYLLNEDDRDSDILKYKI